MPAKCSEIILPSPADNHADDAALTEIVIELRRARSKFPGNDRLFKALVEEVGELAKAMLEGGNIREEATHVACVAIRIMTEGERVG
jgi:hypothetical protein